MRDPKSIIILLAACLSLLAGCGAPALVVSMPGTAVSSGADPSATLAPGEPATLSPFWVLNPTATATPGGAAIILFTATPGEAAPGGTITLRWQTTGAFGAEIVKVLPNQTNGAYYPMLPPSGELKVQLDQSDSYGATFVLKVDTASQTMAAMQGVRVLCTRQWFFTPGPADTCPLWSADQNAGQGFAQKFEHGQIIFSGGDGWAVVLYDDGDDPSWTRLYPDWKPGQPEGDPALVPPAGLEQPVRRIGAVWRSEVIPGKPPRLRLGWATGPEAALATNYQCDSPAYYLISRAAPCFVTGPDGAIIRLGLDARAAWSMWEALPAQ